VFSTLALPGTVMGFLNGRLAPSCAALGKGQSVWIKLALSASVGLFAADSVCWTRSFGFLVWIVL
jgi:nitrate reductase NapE component